MHVRKLNYKRDIFELSAQAKNLPRGLRRNVWKISVKTGMLCLFFVYYNTTFDLPLQGFRPVG